jgi:hypothetical protein
MGVPNIETNPQKFVVGYDSPDGADMGGSALSKDGFYGAVPLVQRIRTEVEGTLAGVTTSLFTTSATSGVPQQSSAFTSQFGNWSTLSASVSGISSTYSATAYTATGAAVTTSASFGTAQALLLQEICIVFETLGFARPF